MSRAYNFEVVVSPVESKDQAQTIADELEQEMGATVEFYMGHPFSNQDLYATFFSNDGCLCGGESDDQAHIRVCKALFNKFPALQEVETKWLCTEYQEWDNTYSDIREDIVEEDNAS